MEIGSPWFAAPVAAVLAACAAPILGRILGRASPAAIVFGGYKDLTASLVSRVTELETQNGKLWNAKDLQDKALFECELRCAAREHETVELKQDNAELKQDNADLKVRVKALEDKLGDG
jgi:hypothetical protein